MSTGALSRSGRDKSENREGRKPPLRDGQHAANLQELLAVAAKAVAAQGAGDASPPLGSFLPLPPYLQAPAGAGRATVQSVPVPGPTIRMVSVSCVLLPLAVKLSVNVCFSPGLGLASSLKASAFLNRATT